MKQKRVSKWLRAAALAVLALLLILGGTVFALWHNELATLSSFHTTCTTRRTACSIT